MISHSSLSPTNTTSMLEILSYEFMQNAILVSIAISICCGVVGSLVVINRLSFLAGGIAHAAYGGVGIATYFKLPLLPSTITFSVIASLLMGAASSKNKSHTDASIGVLWAAGMALGIVLIDKSPESQGDLMPYLFGSILTVSRSDLFMISCLVVVVSLVIYVFFKDMVSLSFEEEFARTRGVAVDATYYLLLSLIAITVVVTIQAVGLILVIALMSIPPLMAEPGARSLPQMMLRAVLWSLLFCLVGLIAAYWLDVSAGACIIAVACFCYFLQKATSRLKRQKKGIL